MADLIAGSGKLVFLDNNGDSAGDMVGGYPPLVYYKARKTTTQTIADGGEEYISFQTTDFDTHSGRKNSYYYEIKQDGLYRVSTQVTAEAAYIRDYIMGLLLSTDSGTISGEDTDAGTWTAIDTTGERYYGGDNRPDDHQGGTLKLSSTHSLSVGDRLAIRVMINTVTATTATIQTNVATIPGLAVDFARDGYLTWFEILKVGSTPS